MSCLSTASQPHPTFVDLSLHLGSHPNVTPIVPCSRNRGGRLFGGGLIDNFFPLPPPLQKKVLRSRMKIFLHKNLEHGTRVSMMEVSPVDLSLHLGNRWSVRSRVRGQTRSDSVRCSVRFSRAGVLAVRCSHRAGSQHIRPTRPIDRLRGSNCRHASCVHMI